MKFSSLYPTFLGGYTIPSGSNIVILINKMHRNKVLWGDDAGEFKPERFEPEKFAKIHPYAYLPFAKGPRSCVGINYANKSIKVVLSSFFRRFKVSTSMKIEEIKFEYAVATQIAQGCKVSLTRRNFASKS